MSTIPRNILARAFELWEIKYREDSSAFMTEEEARAMETATLAEASAIYFEALLREATRAAHATPTQPADNDQASQPKAPKNPMQPLVIWPHGEHRFQRNDLVFRLLKHAIGTGLSVEEISKEGFSAEDAMQLAQLSGYSVSEYLALSYLSEESAKEVRAASAALASVDLSIANIFATATVTGTTTAIGIDIQDGSAA